MPTVRDAMQPDPATVREDTPLEDLLRLMKERGLDSVPVVNEGGRCVGIVTEHDLVIADEGGDLHLPHFIELFGGIVYLESLKHFEERLQKAAAGTAADLMTADPVVVEAGEDLYAAARTISRSKHDNVPVVEHGRLVGLLTRVDVLAELASVE